MFAGKFTIGEDVYVLTAQSIDSRSIIKRILDDIKLTNYDPVDGGSSGNNTSTIVSLGGGSLPNGDKGAQKGISPVALYRSATYPGGQGNPVYVDPNSLTATTSEWGSPGMAETPVWGAFKGLFVARTSQLLGIGAASSSLAGTGFWGATGENLTVQVQTTTYTASVSDWHGTVYFGLMGGVRAIDFHGLSNTRTMTLEVTRSYRVMTGSSVLYTSSSETISMSRVSNFIPNSNGYPINDVVY
ncbi:hypothetical protein ACJJIC_16565 [Microbulbifer sp. ANSA002]|uniref:hypothetical protein n=1 Tax=unclassified Microbulbifer TaxID=2619833 RepID=UPI004040F6F4